MKPAVTGLVFWILVLLTFIAAVAYHDFKQWQNGEEMTRRISEQKRREMLERFQYGIYYYVVDSTGKTSR